LLVVHLSLRNLEHYTTALSKSRMISKRV
jgi:hypothetical protein